MLVSCAGAPVRDGGAGLSNPGSVPSEALIETVDRTHRTTRAPAELREAWDTLRPARDAKPPNTAFLWRLSRLAMVLALHDSRSNAQWAQEGIEAAQLVVTHAPNAVQGHLYAGICKSLLAKHQPSNSQTLSQEAFQHAKKAVQLDAAFNRGATRRLLGGLLIYAPAWPTSVGDLDEGLEVLEALAKEFPQQPVNTFLLAEAYRKADLTKDAIREYKRVLSFPPKSLWKLDGPPYRKRARQALRDLKRMP